MAVFKECGGAIFAKGGVGAMESSKLNATLDSSLS